MVAEQSNAAPDGRAIAAYVEAVRALLGHGGFELTGDRNEAKRFRLAHIIDFLERRGRPDARLTVHIAGSKGKGSAAAIVESVLRAAGKHTLLLTSPDLHQARERIRIDGEPIDYETFARLTRELLADPGTAGWSYFELLTVLGWLTGAEAGCGWQVLEVGLGGRLDTTNAVASKEVAVVMPIDLEHTAILGDTIEQVAAEKAGIITTPCDVVASPMRASALEVIRQRAKEHAAPFHAVAEECALRIVRSGLDEQHFDLRTPVRTYRRLTQPLAGRHQAENAATAVRAAELALARAGEELSEDAVRRGLAAVRWPGRFETVRRRPLVILDALHTPLAARRFREALRELAVPAPHVFVLGMLGGRDFDAVVRELLVEGDQVFVARPSSGRAADVAEVIAAVMRRGAVAMPVSSVSAGVDQARELAGERGSVLVVGSLYTVSEAREHLLGVTGDRAFGLR